MDSVTLAVYLQLYQRMQVHKLILRHIHDVGVILVEFMIAQSAVQFVTDIEFQRLDHALTDIRAGQDFQFIVKAIGV